MEFTGKQNKQLCAVVHGVILHELTKAIKNRSIMLTHQSWTPVSSCVYFTGKFGTNNYSKQLCAVVYGVILHELTKAIKNRSIMLTHQSWTKLGGWVEFTPQVKTIEAVKGMGERLTFSH